MDDPLVKALRSLVEREGGAVALADTIEVNDQSIYQILKGVLLPSGKPKGVGPNLRKKLDAKYPGWISPTYQPAAPALPDLAQLIADAVATMPPARWASVRAQLDQLVAHPEMRDDVLGELRALLTAPPGKAQRSA